MAGLEIGRLDAIVNILSATPASLDNLGQPLPNGVFFIVENVIKKGDGRLWVDTPVWLDLNDISHIKQLANGMDPRLTAVENQVGTTLQQTLTDLGNDITDLENSVNISQAAQDTKITAIETKINEPVPILTPSVNIPAEAFSGETYNTSISNYQFEHTYTISFDPTSIVGTLSDTGDITFTIPNGMSQQITCTISVTSKEGSSKSFSFSIKSIPWKFETDQVVVLRDNLFDPSILLMMNGGISMTKN